MRIHGLLLAGLLFTGCDHFTTPTVSAPVPAVPAVSVKPPSIDLYFVRHGQTISNATGRYTAAGIDKLTPLGEEQAQGVAKQLKGITFDLVVVSPSPRAMATIYPTLVENNLHAYVWPELNECCTERGAKRKIPASATLPRGGPVRIPARFADHIQVLPADSRQYAPRNYNDGLAQIKISADRLHTEAFALAKGGHNPMRLLVVGHSLEGSRLLDMLLHRDPIGDIELKNGCIVHAHSSSSPYELVQKVGDPVTGKLDK